jgi:tol-pal system protein YbgF
MTHRLYRSLATLAIGAVMLPVLLAAGVALAQDQTTRFLISRMDSLEQRLRELERQASGSASLSTGRPQAPTRTAELELRLNQLEQTIRGLTGKSEETDFQNRQLAERLDRLVQDVDRRLKELESAAAAVNRPDAGAAAAPAAKGGGPAQPAPANIAAVPPPGPAAAPGPATPQAVAPAPTPPSAATVAPPPPSGPALPAGTPEEQYKYAIALVRQRAFDDAERAFREFLAVHPTDELASNAQYWLGETLYVRQNYEEAARVFLTGYQQFPESDKAFDSLLKLGLTLGHMGQKGEACATFDELLRRLPKSERRLRPKAELERRNGGCG